VPRSYFCPGHENRWTAPVLIVGRGIGAPLYALEGGPEEGSEQLAASAPPMSDFVFWGLAGLLLFFLYSPCY
jgi:hypothetical protein